MSFRSPKIPRLLRATAALTLAATLALATTACTQKTPEERLEDAVLMLQQGQLARAVLELRTIVRENPGDPSSAQARMYLAQYYWTEGNAPRAIEELEAIHKQYGRTERIGTEAADMLIGFKSQVGDLEGTLRLIEEAIEAYDEDDERHQEYVLLRATVLIDKGEEETIAEGRAILHDIMLQADTPWQRGQAREVLANTYRSQDDFKASNEVYAQYLEAHPEDRMRSRLELAMAVNTINAGDEEAGRADFEAAAEKLLQEAEEELDRESKTQMLRELAAFRQSIDDLKGAEQVMLKIMAENVMSITAIHTQFGIAMMYINSGVFEGRDEHFDRGIEVLEQIKRENPNSSFAMDAETFISQATEVREQYRAHLAAAEEAATEAAAAQDEDEQREHFELELPVIRSNQDTPTLTTSP